MSTIKGVVAAGHEATANAGKEILEAGGNAVDAAIASAFAGCIAEPLLTGLGAAGYMMVHDAKSQKQELIDFAVVVPGKGLAKSQKADLEMTPVGVDFGGIIQVFHGGYASVGVPGFVAGLCAAHKRHGSMPLAELVRPAQLLAKKGVVVTQKQDYLIDILFGIISITPDSKKTFYQKWSETKRRGYFF